MTEKRYDAPRYEYIKVDDELELLALDVSNAEVLFDITDRHREYLVKYLPWVNEVTSVEDSRAFIQSTQEKRAAGAEYGFGILVDGQLAGHISLLHVKGEDGKIPEIGYWIAEDLSGRGITTKAARAMTEFALDELRLDMVLIRAAGGNIASNRIAESLGYYHDEIQVDEEGRPTNYWIKEH